jgi:lysozyme
VDAHLCPDAMPCQVSPAGVALIRAFEGFSSKPYRCPAGVWTIGYGATKGVTATTPPMTLAEAEARLAKDVASFAVGVCKLLTREPLQHQLDAMVSLAYNIGIGAFSTSRVLKHYNAGEFKKAALAFRSWVFASGKFTPGLARRRESELTMFQGGPSDAPPLEAA